MARKRYTYKEFSDDMALMGLSIENDLEFTVEALKKKHKALVKRFHPDKPGGDLEKTKDLNVAHDRLLDWVTKGRPAWPQPSSEPPKPSAAAEAARQARAAKAAEAERAEEERRRTAKAAEEARQRATQAAAQAERERRAREAAEQAAARVAAEEQQRQADAARREEEDRLQALRDRAAAEAAAAEAVRRRQAARRRLVVALLSWPLVTPLRLLRGLVVRLPVYRLAAIGLAVLVFHAWPAIERSQLAASLPAVPTVSWPFPAWLSGLLQPKQVYAYVPPTPWYNVPGCRRRSLIDNACTSR